MPSYVAKALERFAPRFQHGAASPSIYTPLSYGAREQSPNEDISDALTSSEAKRIQEIVGSLLFYARGVDPTILPTVNLLASLQAIPTKQVAAIADRLLQYCAHYPKNELVYHACDMTLFIQVDASYQLVRKHDPSQVAYAISATLAHRTTSTLPSMPLALLYPLSSPAQPKQNMQHSSFSAKNASTYAKCLPTWATGKNPH